ncbi:MAG: Arm DNA-binding domain-containing protein [Hyphomonadaceae bacterium]|jgi:hypothetical protein|nr:Arm DNA-binding domain-containing protein [Hyphomonadaceae bacterium]
MPEVNLTAAFVDKLKPNGAQVEYFDTGSDGLSLRVSQSGTKSWRFPYAPSTRIRPLSQ